MEGSTHLVLAVPSADSVSVTLRSTKSSSLAPPVALAPASASASFSSRGGGASSSAPLASAWRLRRWLVRSCTASQQRDGKGYVPAP
eukprot:967696-Prorocentrum_minimum.AAC.1